ncbi:hypothetical protein HMPREF0548_0423 [Lactobacillus ultunensis DSM 16047]|uniref:Uncharacterized protein n=1 Tax=Lactobacillus ultunensis DSM 16047 TaxID=525365 RepID=C2EL77_9LACO|nr:hypothetical protein HMPREF0548_0423 [Lactobacillus ultunensis DSM 16047]
MRNLLILTLILIVSTSVMVIYLFSASFMSTNVIYIVLAIIGVNEVMVLIRRVLPFIIIRKPIK